MKRLIYSLILLAVAATSVGSQESTRSPSQVVRDYIAAFKEKKKTSMLSCLSAGFFDDYKSNYISKLETYGQEKLRFALDIFGVESMDQFRAMSGETILSTFLDNPASETYWRGFDALDLIVEVGDAEASADQATVRSWLYTKATLPAKVETVYALTKRDGDWRIDGFQKKMISSTNHSTER